ncbi:MAG: D-aminoacylase, partial [Proteobacteria bacterium]|nr:D-aminoacylase [Pseudomonadota bacterium]
MSVIFRRLKGFTFLLFFLAVSCSEGVETPLFDVIISGGTVYDGSGGDPYVADIGIEGDRITAIGDLDEEDAITVVDAAGLAVTPGFINMLSWAPETLMVNGAGLSDLKQGVTLEVFGEGWSFGPWSDAMKEESLKRQTDFKYQIEWTTLGQYL